MKWLGLVLGVLLGLSFRHGDAVFYLGFIGFIVGLVIDLIRGAKSTGSVNGRLTELERTVGKLSQRLDAMERRRAPETDDSPSRTGEIVGAPVIDMEAIPRMAPPQLAATPEPART